MYKDISHINRSLNCYFESKIEKITSHCEASALPSGLGIYLSMKTERSHNMNHINHNSGSCYFENSDQSIVCRHMAQAFAKRYIGTRENNYKQIKEEEDFVKKFNEIGNNYDSEISRTIAHENYICSFDEIGGVLHVIVLKMLEIGLLEAPYFVFSENHVMALRFTRKDNVIKIDFYDPNDTCSHKNIIFKNLNCLKNIHLKHLISHYYITQYFPGLPVINIVSLERCDQEKKPQLRIMADTKEEKLNIATMYHLLSRGVFHLIEKPEDIFIVLKSIKKFPAAEQNKNNTVINLLHSRCRDDSPGLFIALQYGHAETVMAFVLFILESNLSDLNKYNMLQALRADGTPGLLMALQHGHTGTVVAFVSSVLESDLPCQFKHNLLQAPRGDSTPGFFMALKNGHTKTVIEFTKLVLGSDLSDSLMYNLLQAGNKYGSLGFCIALRHGQHKIVAVFTRLILESNLPDLLKYNILLARRLDGVPGFLMALELGHQETVAVFTQLILESTLLSDQDKCVLLQARRGDSTPGFFMALKNGHTETVIDFIKLVLGSDLPDLLRYNLLQARSADGMTGFLLALCQGHEKTVAIFTRLILESGLPVLLKYNLLQTQYLNGTSGILVALQNGYWRTVAGFTRLIMESELPYGFKHNLLQAQYPYGACEFYMARDHV